MKFLAFVGVGVVVMACVGYVVNRLMLTRDPPLSNDWRHESWYHKTGDRR